jgi:hypothetical protein
MNTNDSQTTSSFASHFNQWRAPLFLRVFASCLLLIVLALRAQATEWVWFDDALPSDAVTSSDNGDGWNWVSAPAPLFGNLSHQSNLTNIEHHHEFAWTYSRPLLPNTNDVLFAYVYIDPTNPPSEVMLQWFDTSWEHRAYWGANNLAYGTDGTTSRTNMGPLPRAGQWARLEVRARDVGLEGSTVLGLSFILYGGRANWDTTGKSDRFAGASDTIWFDDSLPSGAVTNADGGDYWNWVSSNPTPFSGSLAHQSIVAPYEHQHSFAWNYGSSLMVNTGDVLFAYAHLDSTSMPTEMMLDWFLDDASSWNHGAYWGANNLSYGTDGTASRTNQGALPAANQWVRLQVPASQVGLEGKSLLGMTFILDSGGATWDLAGKANTNVWFDDAWPADSAALGSEPWTWVSSNPSPYSGMLAHQSANTNGLHEHAFSWTTNPFLVNTGETVYAYVYLDSTHPPDEIMLGFNTTEGENFWEHRAYWGPNDILIYGTDGTASRTNMGALPATGQWVRLEVPAAKVNLEGLWLRGMSFVAYSTNNSLVTWDVVGKSKSTLPPIVALTSPINSAAYSAPATVPLSATASDPDGSIAKVEFFSGSTKIGEADSSPYNATWSGVAAGTYSITARATDNLGATATSSAAMITVNSDIPPTVTLTSPANNATFTTPVTITLSATASDADGTVTSVAFYYGNNLIGQDSTSPYSVTWNNVVVGGTYTLSAVATDNQGVETLSSPITITVNNPAPSVTLTNPANNSSFLSPAAISVSASASDANGTVAKVEFFSNGDKIGEADSSPFTYNWTGVPGGSYSLTAKATDNGGASTTSSAISVTVTNSGGSTGGAGTPRQLPNASVADGVLLSMPAVDDHTLNILSATNLELMRVTMQQSNRPPSAWNWVSNNVFSYPGNITVVVNGVTNTIVKTGFKRRVLYAPLNEWDLRVANELYLQVATPITNNQSVQVFSDGVNWPTTMVFSNTADPLRYSPAIHVNQEGYQPAFAKQAMVGYYLGSLGEMSVGATSFVLVRTADGVPVYTNALFLRPDVHFSTNYLVTPYQKVLLADFTAFQTPGEYRLQVPGLGSSLPFLIDNGIAMDFLRTYALGMYHQRCGSANELPYTRFAHGECHTNLAIVPLPESDFLKTWCDINNSDECISNQAVSLGDLTNYTRGQALTNPASMYYGYSNTAPRDISGGHHDAGDYSKYTIAVASLVHTLVFAVDSFPGVAQFDNLGIPESGDGKSDILQEAKWEADYLTKIQDTDGGFFFLVYPTNGFYETSQPDAPGQQNLWPKNTSATAAAVAALAEMASSPTFKQQFPTSVATYSNAAVAGWSFLMNAMAKHGDATSYQKLTFYGDTYTHTDEIAWAACELYLATSNTNYAKVMASYMPNPTATPQINELIDDFAYAQQAYVFGARSGRVPNSALDPAYLAACSNELCGMDFATKRLNDWSDSAYGTSYQSSTKGSDNPGWYFSMDHAQEMAVAYALNTNSDFIKAILGNLNYEAGCNPVNVSFLAGTGWRRQHEVVNQYTHYGNWRVLPPTGTDSGNLQTDFDASENRTYTPGILASLTYPDQSSTTSAKYPVYDRWADAYNLTTEFITRRVANGMVTMALIAAQTSLTNQPWHFTNCSMTLSTNHSYSSPVDATLHLTETNLNGIRVVWEVQGMEPVFGSNLTYRFTPTTEGTNFVEAEVQWPDGRRAFATDALLVTITNLNVVWFDDALPQGALIDTNAEAWNWVSSNPSPQNGTVAHQSTIASGMHEHSFAWASQTLSTTVDDDLYSWIYPDPSHVPQTVALQWFDELGHFHAAYWGPNNIDFGTNGYQVSALLPPAGQWTQLSVPAVAVHMDGHTANGMYFFLYGGRATWDVAGKKSH